MPCGSPETPWLGGLGLENDANQFVGINLQWGNFKLPYKVVLELIGQLQSADPCSVDFGSKTPKL